MKRLYIYLAALTLLSCQPENIQKEEPKTQPISFTLLSQAPVVAYPEDNVNYKFAISYPEGIASVGTYIDGELIEGSLKEYSDPEVEYTFSYSIKAESVGQSIDFVFEATGIDGHKQSVDYPIYVRSISEEITVALPEDLAADAIRGDVVEFDVKVNTGYNLSKIRTLKDGVEVDYMTKTSGFEQAKSDVYHFAYQTLNTDGGKTISFVVEASDVKGNIGYSAEYKLLVRKGEPKLLYKEIFDTPITISGTAAFDTQEGGITGNAATAFTSASIVNYSGANPDITEGVKSGLTVYDSDITSIVYTSDGVDMCLSKYYYSSMSLISGTYVWARKAKEGWFNIAGIKLHDCTSLSLSFDQCGGAVSVSYSIDGSTWENVVTNKTTSNVKADFSVPDGTQTIELRFTEAQGGAHLRFDNIVLKGE